MSSSTTLFCAGNSIEDLEQHRWVRLDIEISRIDLEEDPESDDPILGTIAPLVTVAANFDFAMESYFDDYLTDVEFPGARDAGNPNAIGSVLIVENSAGSEQGMVISVSGQSGLDAIDQVSGPRRNQSDSDPPFARLRVWFTPTVSDGGRGEFLVENMLNGPPRALIRVEVMSIGIGQ